MNLWKNDYNKLKFALEKLGWECIRDETSGLERWYSQGMLYSNFVREGKAIHIEYGDEDNVFGEVIEC